MFLPYTDGILSTAKGISKEATKDGALVSIESTIPKGTSRKVFELLNHRLHVVHAPHRWYALEEKEYGVNQLRVIGGVTWWIHSDLDFVKFEIGLLVLKENVMHYTVILSSSTSQHSLIYVIILDESSYQINFNLYEQYTIYSWS